MSSIAPPDVREMRTPDLYTARANSAAECLQPLLRDATSAVRELACSSCPLAAICGEIRARETAPSAYTPAASTVCTATAEAAAGDELAARRPRRIRQARIWRAA